MGANLDTKDAKCQKVTNVLEILSKWCFTKSIQFHLTKHHFLITDSIVGRKPKSGLICKKFMSPTSLVT